MEWSVQVVGWVLTSLDILYLGLWFSMEINGLTWLDKKDCCLLLCLGERSLLKEILNRLCCSKSLHLQHVQS
jgi:hypothetical protein